MASSAAVESFAEFAVKELIPKPCVSNESVVKAVMEASQEYMTKGKLCEEEQHYHLLIDQVFEELKALGKLDPHYDANEGKGTFRKDLELCLSEYLMYEYLSRNWDKMDAIISANTPAEEEEEEEEEATSKDEESEEKKVMSENWKTLKTKYFRHKVHADLGHTREFMTMTEILKSVNDTKVSEEVLKAEEILGKANSPTIVFLGGGMGAGKSTVVNLLKERKEGIFSGHIEPVVIEADALKMMDPVFQALNELEDGANAVSQIVHGYSTDAANKQLLFALKEQRNIIMDGTMTWMPYVQQTIAMVRDSHINEYRLGPGYQVNKDTGETTEQYWDVVQPHDTTVERHPYKVEMVGVTVDPEKAVARGLRRKLITGRGVPARGQLRSHKLYSDNFEPYLDLLDKTMLFDTSGQGDPQMIAMKETGQPLLTDANGAYAKFLRKQKIADHATGVEDMYADDGPTVTFSRDGISRSLLDVLSSSGRSA